MELLKNISKNLIEEICKAREISWENFGRKIYFYAPGFIYYSNKYFRSSPSSFPSISITGEYCALKCQHCGGRILKTMIPAQTPQKLIEVCSSLKESGALGCLISGGCLPNGSVPIARFIDAIAEIKRRLGLTIVIHTGLIDYEIAKRLKEASIDAVLIDIIGSNETIREIYHLHDMSINDYEKTLESLRKAEVPFIPHVLIGLHYGTIKGEFKALEIIKKYNPLALILIAFFPIKGTEMEHVKPPPPSSIINVLVQARLMMPNVPIALGCARPKGKHRVITDLLAIKAGVNAIAFPSLESICKAEELGLEIGFSRLCCSQIYRDYKFKK